MREPLDGVEHMVNSRRKLFLECFSVLCCLLVVIVSASKMVGVQSKAQLIGVIAGSFGAGATFVNAMRNHSARRREGK
jgi:hypothetical protein